MIRQIPGKILEYYATTVLKSFTVPNRSNILAPSVLDVLRRSGGVVMT